jgi:4-hydroxy-tetrahydrodipicolinate synthase
MLPATVLRLANDFKNIVAKEASGDMVRKKLIKNKPENFYLVISGDDMIVYRLAGGSVLFL